MPRKFAHGEPFGKWHVRSLRDDTRAIDTHAANMPKSSIPPQKEPRPGWKLRECRKHAGLTLEQLAERVGTSKGYLSDMERGERRYNQDWVELLARELDVDEVTIFTGPLPPASRGVPVVGYVGAGGDGDFADDYMQGEAIDWIEPGLPEGRIALRVRGDSMEPLAHEGEVVMFGPQVPPQQLVGRRVMARLRDGGKLFKVLGPQDPQTGRFALYSLNSAYEPILAELEWVLPFEGLRAK